MAAPGLLHFLPSREKVSGKRRTRTTTRRPITVVLPQEHAEAGSPKSRRREPGRCHERSKAPPKRRLSGHASGSPTVSGSKAGKSPQAKGSEGHPGQTPLLSRDPKHCRTRTSSSTEEFVSDTESGPPPPKSLRRRGSAGESRRDVLEDSLKKDDGSRPAVGSARRRSNGVRERSASRHEVPDARSSEERPPEHERSSRAAPARAPWRSWSSGVPSREQPAKGATLEKSASGIVNGGTRSETRGSREEEKSRVGRDGPLDVGGAIGRRSVRRVPHDVPKRADRRSSSESTAEIGTSPPVSPFVRGASRMPRTEDRWRTLQRGPSGTSEEGRGALRSTEGPSSARQKAFDDFLVPPARFVPRNTSTPARTEWVEVFPQSGVPDLFRKGSRAATAPTDPRSATYGEGSRKATSRRSGSAGEEARRRPEPDWEEDPWGIERTPEESATSSEECSEKNTEGGLLRVHLWRGRRGRSEEDVSGLDVCLTAVRLVLGNFRARSRSSVRCLDLLRFKLERGFLSKMGAARRYQSVLRKTEKMRAAAEQLHREIAEADGRLRRLVSMYEQLKAAPWDPHPLDYCFRALEVGFRP